MRILLTLFLVSALAVTSYAKDWRGITPLQSTRADVEKLLGHSANDGYAVTYPVGGEVVTIVYSSGGCSDKGRIYDVPPDTVLSVRVSSGGKSRFADLGIDLKKFREVEDSELPGIFYYINDDDGVTYDVEGGLVWATEYRPATKDRKLRRCVK